MENILIAFVGAVIGIIATVVVGRYYYVRTTDKRLNVYIQLASPVLGGIDPKVREVLKVHYRNIEVVDLFQLQFLVANEGVRAIRDCIEPLTVGIPSNIKLLDATVLYVRPENRTVKVNVRDEDNTADSSTVVECIFPLLNKGDFFLVKLLLDGLLKPLELQFRITADDLPPVINTKMLPFSLMASDAPRTDWLAMVLGILCLLFSLVSVFSTTILIDARRELLFLFSLSKAPALASVLTWAIIILSGLSALFLLIVAMVSIISIGFAGRLRRKSRFALPSHLYNFAFPFSSSNSGSRESRMIEQEKNIE